MNGQLQIADGIAEKSACFVCGAEAGTNRACTTCAQWARIAELAWHNRGMLSEHPTANSQRRTPRKKRKPQHQPGPVVEVGCLQLPPSDRE